MSNERYPIFGLTEIPINSFIRCTEFLMLKVYGSGILATALKATWPVYNLERFAG
jgi:hypothetical protein